MLLLAHRIRILWKLIEYGAFSACSRKRLVAWSTDGHGSDIRSCFFFELANDRCVMRSDYEAKPVKVLNRGTGAKRQGSLSRLAWVMAVMIVEGVADFCGVASLAARQERVYIGTYTSSSIGFNL
jgi:hypothetical protein